MVLQLRSNIQRISVLISAFALIVSLVFTKTLTSRIRKVLDGIVSVREGQYNYRVDVSGRDEIAGLAEEFNRLTDRLQSTENIRRRFVSDASHELKTPLAAIRLLSDSILQTDTMDMDTVHGFATDIGDEAERLARISWKKTFEPGADGQQNRADKVCGGSWEDGGVRAAGSCVRWQRQSRSRWKAICSRTAMFLPTRTSFIRSF